MQSAGSRNQTILDDAAWMSEKLYNLQKTGFLRYPAVSKLRDSGEVRSSLDSLPVNLESDEEMSCLSSASASNFDQVFGATLRHSQTDATRTDEPLSAFRLSEVTLSEEDLLTEISSPTELSTSKSTPVSVQSCRNLGQRASEILQRTSPAPSNGNNLHDYAHESNISYSASLDQPNSPASSEYTSSNGSNLFRERRGDLVLRLEALQYRAELAAKEGNCQFGGALPNWESQYANLWNEQASEVGHDSLLSVQKPGTFVKQSDAAAAGLPTHSNLRIESVSWPEQLETSIDSTCWLKSVNDEVEEEPCLSPLFHSSTRTIRPEYYLPLSREEEPVFEDAYHIFPSPQEGPRAEREDSIKRLIPQGALSPLRQHPNFRLRQEEIKSSRPGRVRNHKQVSPVLPKSRRSLESSMDSLYGAVKGSCASSPPLIRPSSPVASPDAARRTVLKEPRTSRSPIPVRQVQENNNSVTKSLDLKASAMGMSCQIGKIKDDLKTKVEYDGESSWISEENVEGFLSSRSFVVDEIDALSSTNEQPHPVLNAKLIHSSAETSTSLSNEKTSKDESFEVLQGKSNGRGILYTAHAGSVCFNDEIIKGSIESLVGMPEFDGFEGSFLSSQDGSTPTAKTGTLPGLSEAGSFVNSTLIPKGFSKNRISYQSVYNLSSHLGDDYLKHDSIECSEGKFCSKPAKHFHQDAEAKEQTSPEESPVRYHTAALEELGKELTENKLKLEARCASVEAQRKPEDIHDGRFHAERCTVHDMVSTDAQQCNDPWSADFSLSSKNHEASLVSGGDQQWLPPANGDENVIEGSKIHSQGLLEEGYSEHKAFARVLRSLSFSEEEKRILQKSKAWSKKDLGKSIIPSFSHDWNTNSSNLPKGQNYQNSEGKDVQTRCKEETLHNQKFAEVLDGLELHKTSALFEKGILKQMPLLIDRNEALDMGYKHARSNEVRVTAPDNFALHDSCNAASKTAGCNISEAEEHSLVLGGMVQTVLLSGESENECGRIMEGKVVIGSKKTSQQAQDLTLDDSVKLSFSPVKMLSKVKECPVTEDVLADYDSWQKAADFGGLQNIERTEVDNKGCDWNNGQALNVPEAHYSVIPYPNKESLMGGDQSISFNQIETGYAPVDEEVTPIRHTGLNPGGPIDGETFPKNEVEGVTVEDGEVLYTTMLPTHNLRVAESKPEIVHGKSTMPEQHVNMAAFDSEIVVLCGSPDGNKSMLVEQELLAVDKDRLHNEAHYSSLLEYNFKETGILKLPGSSGPKDSGRGKAPESLLSVYKNPLWLDELGLDFDIAQKDSQDQEMLDLSYIDREDNSLLKIDRSRVGFSKRSLDDVWNTYEGVGELLTPATNSPSHAIDGVSDAGHILIGFDTLVDSSDSNGIALGSLWDVESSALKKLRKMGEKIEDGSISVWKPLTLKSCLLIKDSDINEEPEFGAKKKPDPQDHASGSQDDQQQHSAQSLMAMEFQTTNHDASCSCPVKIKNASTVNVHEHCDAIPINSALTLSHSARLEVISQLKVNLTRQIRDLSLSNVSVIPDAMESEFGSKGLFEKVLGEISAWPYGPFPMNSFPSNELLDGNIAPQKATLVVKESAVSDYVPITVARFSMGDALSESTYCEKLVPQLANSEKDNVACQIDEAKEVIETETSDDKNDHNGTAIIKNPLAQSFDAADFAKKTTGGASKHLDTKLSGQFPGHYDTECSQPLDTELVPYGFVNALQEVVPVIHSNDGVEVGEEVKKVTFMFSDSKEPQKDVQAVESTSLPEVPMDFLSAWVWSFFSRAMKVRSSCKRKEQKQLPMSNKTQEDQADLNIIGKKVEALEAEIDKFKEENKKLQKLVKCLIRKMKQLQHGLRVRKRHGSSRGFMTCIFSVHIKSSRSATLRKS